MRLFSFTLRQYFRHKRKKVRAVGENHKLAGTENVVRDEDDKRAIVTVFSSLTRRRWICTKSEGAKSRPRRNVTADTAARSDVGTGWTARPRRMLPNKMARSGIWWPTTVDWSPRRRTRAVARTGPRQSRTTTMRPRGGPRTRKTGPRPPRLAAAAPSAATGFGGTPSSARESRTCMRTVSRALSS